MINCKECKFYKDTCECDIKYTKFGTVFDHTLHVLDSLPDNSTFEVQISALLHDIGKNEKTYDTVDGKQRFIGHELLGSKIAKRRLENLKFSSNEINKISFLIEHHMDVYKLEDASDKSLRKFIRNAKEFKDDLFILVNADGNGTLYFDRNKKEIVSIAPKNNIQNRIKILEEELKRASEKPFVYFNGNELMKEFNINKPCKDVGILKKIQNDIIDEFGVNLDKNSVLTMIKERFLS